MKYIGLMLLVLTGFLVNSSWSYFQSFTDPAHSGVAVQSTIKNMLKQTQLTTQEKTSVVVTAENIKNLQQQELKHGENYSELVGLSYHDEIIQPVKITSVKSVSKAMNKYYNKYTVSMVVITPTDRYAVVDGRFAHEGEILKDKDMLKTISVGKISVLQQGKLNTITVSGAKL